jgi:hypothetical protein
MNQDKSLAVRPRFALAPQTFSAGLAALCIALFTGCSSSDDQGGTASGSSSLQLLQVSVIDGATWQINRPIEFKFSHAVDFSTVNPNTIEISQPNGLGTVGEYYSDISAPESIFWQPVCPTEADYSDAGLLPSTAYQIFVRGADTSSLTLTGVDGEQLSEGRTINFTTMNAGDLAELFFDAIPGPPIPLVRVPGSTDVGSYVEFGGDPQARTYFEYNSEGEGTLADGSLVPLNLYSETNSQVAMVIEFNQPVNPAVSNIDQSRVRLEFDEALNPSAPEWRPVICDVELSANCSESGATIRLTPIGILPQGRKMRLFVSTEFEDLAGVRNPLPLNRFGLMESETDVNDQRDHYVEEFSFGGSELGSNEDGTAVTAEPSADWGAGGLEAGLGFGGTGGPNGEFDWHIAPNTDFRVDTNSTQIFGGPGGIPVYQQFVLNGRVDVRDLFIPDSSILRVQGEDPVTIYATGTVTINGQLLATGSNARSVFSLNTPFQPENGAAGVAGGGNGGVGSYLTNQSTPRGGSGFGAFQTPGGGGEGGETGYSNDTTNYGVNRRAAGGGGGRLGHNVLLNDGCPEQLIIGLDAEDGFPGSNNALGASGNPRPYGGRMGPQPFFNPDNSEEDFEDDFYGVMLRNYDGDTGDLDPLNDPRLVVGELPFVWAGSGGGAGGDASRTASYPPAAFVYSNEDKGCGGGGGGGSLTVLALGDIVFGPSGRLDASGGYGSGGENTAGVNRIGGGSGGGSGGHVVIQTSGKIDLTELPTNWNPLTSLPPISVKGGQGGEGAGGQGGANDGETQPTKDSVHNGNTNPFSLDACGGSQNTPKDCAGGDGGPGILQFHVSDLSTDIIPPGGTLSQSLGLAVKPPPLGYNSVTGSWDHQMLPEFGRISSSQSDWVPLGGVAVEADTPVLDPFDFLFGGTDPATGEVSRTDGIIDSLAPILSSLSSLESPSGVTGLPKIDPNDSRAIIVDAADLGAGNDIFLDNITLLKRFRLDVGSSSSAIVAASYTSVDLESGGAATLRLQVSNEAPILPLAGSVSVIPRYFSISTNGTQDSLPASSKVTIEFQATELSSLGGPDTEAIKPAPGIWTSDITSFNGDSNNPKFQFFRFRVKFDIGVNTELTANTPRPRIDFLTVPFIF